MPRHCCRRIVDVDAYPRSTNWQLWLFVDLSGMWQSSHNNKLVIRRSLFSSLWHVGIIKWTMMAICMLMFNKFVVKPIIRLCGIYLACYAIVSVLKLRRSITSAIRSQAETRQSNRQRHQLITTFDRLVHIVLWETGAHAAAEPPSWLGSLVSEWQNVFLIAAHFIDLNRFQKRPWISETIWRGASDHPRCCRNGRYYGQRVSNWRVCCVSTLYRFRLKYHPEEYSKRCEETRAAVQQRCDVFTKLLDLNHVTSVSLDVSHTNAIVKLLDAGTAAISAFRSYLTLWRPMVPHGYSYKASYARPG